MTNDNRSRSVRAFRAMIENTTGRSFEGESQLNEIYDLLHDAQGVGMLSGREWDYLITLIELNFISLG